LQGFCSSGDPERVDSGFVSYRTIDDDVVTTISYPPHKIRVHGKWNVDGNLTNWHSDSADRRHETLVATRISDPPHKGAACTCR
jgi:hypothetical protein